MQKGNSQLLILLVVVSLLLVGGGVIYQQNMFNIRNINSFDDCAKAGYPVQLSFPGVCTTPDGRSFTQELTEEEKKSLIPPVDETVVCEINDEQFCDFLEKVKSAISDSNFSALLDLQEIVVVTCDTEAAYNPTMCDGVANGEKRQGYAMGRTGSEGSVITRDRMIEGLRDYFNRDVPLNYYGNWIKESSGIIYYLDQKKEMVAELNIKKTDNSWRIRDIVIGPLYENEIESINKAVGKSN